MVDHSNLFRCPLYVVRILDMVLILYHFLQPHMHIHILQQIGHFTFTLTLLETNENKNYKATLFQ